MVKSPERQTRACINKLGEKEERRRVHYLRVAQRFRVANAIRLENGAPVEVLLQIVETLKTEETEN